ncbi:MAG: ATP-binding protein [Deltaproteobacteria bacterium]|nr:ATP-binding protein [Deltaproteobacteria bacterium]
MYNITNIARTLKKPSRSFFLFGPRGTGKSTWLKQVMPDTFKLDFLDTSLFLELSRDPHLLEAIVGNKPEGSWIILDEIQKIPPLLDEVHRLMESKRWLFALCGSSARKLKRGGANLLAGRAMTISMEGFSADEIRKEFNLSRAINFGTLPMVHNEPEYAVDILRTYVNTYLKEELQAEGLIRNVPPFLRFLSLAGQINGQAINSKNISREASVARSTVDTYFSILTDTLVGHILPAWRPGFKVRETAQPKFYWFDPGVARAAAGMLDDQTDRFWEGTALETLIFHELRVYNEISGKHRMISYYRTPAGVEIDFVIETSKGHRNKPPNIIVIEVKLAEKWNRAWEKPMRNLAENRGVVVDHMIGVYCGTKKYLFDGVKVMPVEEFIKSLYAGEFF